MDCGAKLWKSALGASYSSVVQPKVSVAAWRDPTGQAPLPPSAVKLKVIEVRELPPLPRGAGAPPLPLPLPEEEEEEEDQ